MAYRKLSETKYQIEIGGEYVTLDVPYAKADLIFRAFVTNGGVIDGQGQVQTDMLALLASFSSVANILLTRYSPTGEIVEEGNCSMLAPSEIKELFSLGVEVVENFTNALLDLQKSRENSAGVEGESKKKAKKTTD